MIKFGFDIPTWLHWLIPTKIKEDHDRRCGLLGRAATSFVGGAITITTIKAAHPPEPKESA